LGDEGGVQGLKNMGLLSAFYAEQCSTYVLWLRSRS